MTRERLLHALSTSLLALAIGMVAWAGVSEPGPARGLWAAWFGMFAVVELYVWWRWSSRQTLSARITRVIRRGLVQTVMFTTALGLLYYHWITGWPDLKEPDDG